MIYDILSKNKKNPTYVSISDIQKANDIIQSDVTVKCSTTTGENVTDLKMKVLNSYFIHFYIPKSLISPKMSKKRKTYQCCSFWKLIRRTIPSS